MHEAKHVAIVDANINRRTEYLSMARELLLSDRTNEINNRCSSQLQLERKLNAIRIEIAAKLQGKRFDRLDDRF